MTTHLKNNNTSLLEMASLRPARIDPQLILGLDPKPEDLVPISGLNIPNITIPAKLRGTIRSVGSDDPIAIQIRQLLNSTTLENIKSIIDKMKNLILTKVQDESTLAEISKEVFDNFLIMEKNIPIYLQLLNSICGISISLPDDPSGLGSRKISKSIANYFLNECKKHILAKTTQEHLRKMVSLDLDNPDEEDKYNREKDKTNNLIITICYLYGQRNSNYIRLNAPQVYPVIVRILDLHKNFQEKMEELGNPYNDEECSDEEEFEELRKMCTLCTEQLYTFVVSRGKEFKEDDTEVKNETLRMLLVRFRDEVIPKIVEDYLDSKCKSPEIKKILQNID